MTTILLVAQVALALILLPRIALLALIVSAAAVRRIRGGGPRPPAFAGDPTRFTVLVPAHDEQGAVGVTVRSCRAVDYEADRFQVVVIADNCTDGTADEAREAGAIVVERSTPDRRSKGYALEDFFGSLGRSAAIRPAEAFVLVDADTSVDPGLLRAFDAALQRGDDFIQGYYTVRNADASWRTRLMTFAFSLANGVWLLGLDGLGLGVGLKGNGMCFRASALARRPWRAYGLVEDMEYAWHLRLAGERVRFEPSARVYGEMVSRGGSGATSQRRRWEEGRRALRTTFRREIRSDIRLSWWRRLLYAIDLDFPPLGRLVALMGVESGLVMLGWPMGLPSFVLWGGLASVAFGWLWFFGYIAAPFVLIGLPVRFALALLHAPYYLAWKATLGRRGRTDRWVRTPREISHPQ